MDELELYRSAYVNEQEEEMDYVPELDDIEPMSTEDEDWEYDDSDYYDSLANEFNWLNNYEGSIKA